LTGLSVALVVSGHGYGHSVRCAQVAAALLQRDARVVVHTSAPQWLYPREVVYTRVETDVGVVQRGGLELDIDATREAWQAFTSATRVNAEARLLRAQDVDFVLGDVPPLAFAAAAQAGIPSAGLANFTWDWIYGARPDFDEAIACIRVGYAQAGRLLRLPLHSADPDAFCAFTEIEDVPLIARKAGRSRDEVRREYGIAEQQRVVLLSFGGFDAPGMNVAALGAWQDYVFVVAPPINVKRHLPANVLVLDRQSDDYVSLLAACDAIITKPGYGIVADCLANRVPVLYTERGPFREYPVLADALERFGNARYITNADLFEGHVGPYLDALLGKRKGWTAECMNGADVVAERIFALVGTSTR
jgi:UDP:flavonoid glycosyltransferase YjiC (YdhE family)